ncbi:MAG: hypothetical protein AVDCRST_MAG54-1513, partial [uncultured Actinomycetospora sp.]
CVRTGSRAAHPSGRPSSSVCASSGSRSISGPRSARTRPQGRARHVRRSRSLRHRPHRAARG